MLTNAVLASPGRCAEVASSITESGDLSEWTLVWSTETNECVAEWLVSPPYTGPARANDNYDEWVHYPFGALKVRFVLWDDEKRVETTHGVQYAVPPEIFLKKETLQDFIATRVVEFIANRNAYLMRDGKYHKGQ